jgi:hypothetical protein
MRSVRGRLFSVAAAWMILTAGCGSRAAPKSRGEAETVLVAFYESVIREDCSAAHALLHSDSRVSCPLEQFSALARVYRRRLGFELQELRVRSCEEHDLDAMAHVLLIGRQEGHERSFRDAITLRRDGETWGIVLPIRFGRPH